jgi:glycosyltransferase involved in cell wall biosynthesis
MSTSSVESEEWEAERMGLWLEPLTTSVIVPAYRRPERLGKLLRMLLQQDVPSKSYEVIVVDDGSPEPVCSIACQYSETSEVAVRCLRKANGGPASARAFGAREARGEYLLFVDDDMLVGKDFVREHLQTQREIGPAAVTCDFDWHIEAEPKSFERWYKRTVTGWTKARDEVLVPIGEGLFEFSNQDSGGGFLTAANLSVAKTDYVRSGGFDTDYRSPSCEDQDFGVRLREAGVRSIVTTRARATHIETDLTLGKVCKRQEAGWKDAVRFMRRRGLLDQPVEPEIAIVNGPVKLGTDPWPLVAKKILKTLVASDYFSRSSFGLVRIVDRVAPESAWAQKCYDLVVGAYIRKGWLTGLQVYGSEPASKELPQIHGT